MRKPCMKMILLALLFLAVPVSAENYVEQVKKGNEAVKNGQYKEALEFYHAAETDLPESPELEYNMAGALHLDGAYEEAVERFDKAVNSPQIDVEQAAHYNLGNTKFRTEDFQGAIESYQKALELDSDDIDAKFNLELARRRLKDQMKQQEQQQDEQQDQKKQQQEQQQDQQKQDEQEPEKQEEQQEQQQQDQKQEEQQQPQPRDEKEMSKEDAERILNALKDDEQDIQKKRKLRQPAGDYRGKDW